MIGRDLRGEASRLRNHGDAQGRLAISNCQLVPRVIGAGKPRSREHLLGHHELALVLLGQRLEPARHVHGVAHRGQIARLSITHFPYDDRPRVNPDPDAQRRLELGSE